MSYERDQAGHYRLHARAQGSLPLTLDSNAIVITSGETP